MPTNVTGTSKRRAGPRLVRRRIASTTASPANASPRAPSSAGLSRRSRPRFGPSPPLGARGAQGLGRDHSEDRRRGRGSISQSSLSPPRLCSQCVELFLHLAARHGARRHRPLLPRDSARSARPRKGPGCAFRAFDSARTAASPGSPARRPTRSRTHGSPGKEASRQTRLS